MQAAILEAAIVIEWFEKVAIAIDCALLEFDMRKPISFSMDCAMINLRDARDKYNESLRKWRKRHYSIQKMSKMRENDEKDR